MCVTCGCSPSPHGHEHDHTHDPDHAHAPDHAHEASPLHVHTHTLTDGTVIQHAHVHGEHGHSHLNGQGDRWADPAHPYAAPAAPGTSLPDPHGHTRLLEQNILAHNDHIAAHNRRHFQAAHILALNLVSSPGAGKTTLLTRTIQDLQRTIPLAVIEGDQATSHDSDRIRATGCPAIQVNTGTGCHLEAAMIQRGLTELNPPPHSILMIENVGNLVCPALFDLGEAAKVAILSVTEGEDKPIKYPHMFRASQVMVLNKIDLLPYVQFDVAKCLDYARQVNPQMRIFQVSATTGEGLTDWYDWLRQRVATPTASATV